MLGCPYRGVDVRVSSPQRLDWGASSALAPTDAHADAQALRPRGPAAPSGEGPPTGRQPDP